MLQPFYSTHADVHGEHDEYFVDPAGAYVMRERIQDLGRPLTLRTDILPTRTFFRSFWSPDAKRALASVQERTTQQAEVAFPCVEASPYLMGTDKQAHIAASD
jgi:hypothetical protein